MKRTKILWTAVLVSSFAVLWSRSAQSEAPNKAMTLLEFSEQSAELADRVSRATVYLSVAKNSGGDMGRGLGTGFVVDAIKGIVVTNAHVMDGAKSATVQLHDGRVVRGSLLGVDEQTDLAVLDIPAGSSMHQLEWGDSDLIRPGHLVMAIGSPLGMEGTTSLGVISALGRRLEMVEDSYEDFLQFDAFIDRGSSGGPLVNMQGEVIGINTAIGGGGGSNPAWRGIGYAIPTAIAERYVGDLAETGTIRRGWIGVSVDSLDAQGAKLRGLDHTYGVRVKSVVKDGPAENAGVRPDDVILEIDGREIRTPNQVKARIAAVAPGSSVKVKILSKRAIRTIRVTLGVLDA
ncbi:MAG: trypsin-like peptidase domain-containing protein [Planctomycetota bacterium]|nr:trypsin-like peptidase domain-containing protein [Planctomycetota bacterium]MDA1114522.1 trypsin-like peptidase domain-containing protein [Planctomycetota bacterium]